MFLGFENNEDGIANEMFQCKMECILLFLVHFSSVLSHIGGSLMWQVFDGCLKGR